MTNLGRPELRRCTLSHGMTTESCPTFVTNVHLPRFEVSARRDSGIHSAGDERQRRLRYIGFSARETRPSSKSTSTTITETLSPIATTSDG